MEADEVTPGFGVWILQLQLKSHLASFSDAAIRADALESDYYVDKAEGYLAMIEDDIARYRKGKPQAILEAKEEIENE